MLCASCQCHSVIHKPNQRKNSIRFSFHILYIQFFCSLISIESISNFSIKNKIIGLQNQTHTPHIFIHAFDSFEHLNWNKKKPNFRIKIWIVVDRSGNLDLIIIAVIKPNGIQCDKKQWRDKSLIKIYIVYLHSHDSNDQRDYQQKLMPRWKQQHQQQFFFYQIYSNLRMTWMLFHF